MKTKLITCILVALQISVYAQSNEEFNIYLDQGKDYLNKGEYLIALEFFDYAYNFAEINEQKETINNLRRICRKKIIELRIEVEKAFQEIKKKKQVSDSLLIKVQNSNTKILKLEHIAGTAIFDKVVKAKHREWKGYANMDMYEKEKLLNSIDSIDLSSNGLVFLPKEIVECKSLRSLNLLNNPNIVWKDAFNLLSQLPNLVDIKISIMDINSIDKDNWHMISGLHIISDESGNFKNFDFFRLTHINYLSLEGQLFYDNRLNLTRFSGLYDLKNLEYLNLSYCGLDSLHSDISSIKNLRELHLVGNGLIELPNTIFQLEQLNILNLANNDQLQFNSRFFQSLSKLNRKVILCEDYELHNHAPTSGALLINTGFGLYSRSLDNLYDQNNIIHLEKRGSQTIYSNFNTKGISNLKNMYFLKFNGLKIGNSINNEIFEISTLRTLNISYNDYNYIPKNIGKLKYLNHLIINSNRLEVVPKSIGKLQNLETLELSGNEIKKIPKSIGKLQNLETLELSGNEIKKIPKSIGKLQNLETLELSHNEIKKIPKSIRKLQNLETLELSHNEIKKIPKSIRKLQNLETLELSSNKITRIPKSINRLNSLISINLDNNELASPIPPSLFSFYKLSFLSLSNNNLTFLPESNYQLENLIQLDLSNNQLKTFPKILGKLNSLESLNLRDNELTSLPKEIGNLVSLKNLNLEGNKLIAIPQEISNLPKLNRISLGGNDNLDLVEFRKVIEGFNKPIYISNNNNGFYNKFGLTVNLPTQKFYPKEYGSLINLEKIYLEFNEIFNFSDLIALLSESHKNIIISNVYNPFFYPNSIKVTCRYPKELPRTIGKLKKLIYLELANARVKAIPKEIGELQSLEKLDISNNDLSSLPKAIGKLYNLKVLDISNNDLSSLPKAIGKLHNLKVLDISNNNLGSIPKELGELQSLEKLDISNNDLSSLPKAIGKLHNLKVLDISNNNLNSIPEEIGELKNLTHLFIINNDLSSLPKAIGKLHNLKVLEIYYNQLVSIPEGIGELQSLAKFDISSNNLISLPKEINKLHNLTYLNLSENELQVLPEKFFQLELLDTLVLYQNNLSFLPEGIQKLERLKFLKLSNNKLKALPDSIGLLRNLRFLSLQNNKLVYLPKNIGKLNKIHKLDFSGNDSLSFSSLIYGLMENKYEVQIKLDKYYDPNASYPLFFEFNYQRSNKLLVTLENIDAIPPDIEKIQNLIYLEVKNQKLKSLPIELKNLRRLRHLNLIGNEIPHDQIDTLIKLMPNCNIEF